MGKRKRSTSQRLARQRLKNEKRIRKVEVEISEKSNHLCFFPESAKAVSHTSIITLKKGTLMRRAIFLRAVLPVNVLAILGEELISCGDLWQWREDKTRGPKKFIIDGLWTAQGHARPGDKVYVAGTAGRHRHLPGYLLISCCLEILSTLANAFLRKYRPDVCFLLDYQHYSSVFGYFNMFMCPRGTSKMHVDRMDLLAFLFLILTDDKCGGGLELGGSGLYCAWKIGDCIILDSSQIHHGSRKYFGDVGNRLVGIFILQTSFLRAHRIQMKCRVNVTFKSVADDAVSLLLSCKY